jgi:hypothetical protein
MMMNAIGWLGILVACAGTDYGRQRPRCRDLGRSWRLAAAFLQLPEQ